MSLNIQDLKMLANKSEIKNLWRIKPVNLDSIIEMRAINKNGVISILFKAVDHDSVESLCFAFEQEALRLNDLGYNIYIVMNEIKPEFAGRSAGDNDILFRTLLLIDIDRVETKNPATDDEVEHARLLASEVVSHLTKLGFPEPATVMSGNGYHIYYPMDNVPNDQEAKVLVQTFLKGLAAKFDNAYVKIDTSVFNASRITKVLGTIARKGESSVDRPYRMARLV